jgi:hypothetical protein
VACGQEYRRYPVTDARGAGWEDLGRLFTCNSVWATPSLADKCCHVPRCRCCTVDGSDAGNASATRCSPRLAAVTACTRDPAAAACTDDCSCVAGFVPLEAVDAATGAVATSCLLASQCRACKAAYEQPPKCAVCTRAF